MAVPPFHVMIRPMLELAADGELHISEAIDKLSGILGLSPNDLEEMVPSGQQTRFGNRTTWAKTYLKKAGLVRYPRRGYFDITEQGREFLQSHEGPIKPSDLKRFETFAEFSTVGSKAQGETSEPESGSPDPDGETTPDEQIVALHDQLNDELAAELVERVQGMPPIFFERLLVKLLIRMGYGGSAEEAGRDLGKSGDGGVDGVIDQDRLGVDQVYIQAKRYSDGNTSDGNTVGSGAVRDFFGALNMKRATKGIFFTTSSFTSGARETAAALGTRIVLIDGRQLARLMIETSIGCREETTLVIRRVDEDFFDMA
ncbi:MAG: restriction endonuclease [Pseudomonadota bacterium]